VREHLTPRGVVLINVGHPEGSDGLEKVLSATLHTDFATVLRDPSEPTNTVLLATDARASARALGRDAPTLPPDLRPVALAASRRLAAPLRGGDVYTDDRAPVEWLIVRSLVKYAAEPATKR
jgi:hypothetical protein